MWPHWAHPSVVPCSSSSFMVILSLRGSCTASSSMGLDFSTAGPNSTRSVDRVPLRLHGVAVIALMAVAFQRSAIGLRRILLTLMTLPSALATL